MFTGESETKAPLDLSMILCPDLKDGIVRSAYLAHPCQEHARISSGLVPCFVLAEELCQPMRRHFARNNLAFTESDGVLMNSNVHLLFCHEH